MFRCLFTRLKKILKIWFSWFSIFICVFTQCKKPQGSISIISLMTLLTVNPLEDFFSPNFSFVAGGHIVDRWALSFLLFAIWSGNWREFLLQSLDRYFFNFCSVHVLLFCLFVTVVLSSEAEALYALRIQKKLPAFIFKRSPGNEARLTATSRP